MQGVHVIGREAGVWERVGSSLAYIMGGWSFAVFTNKEIRLLRPPLRGIARVG